MERIRVKFNGHNFWEEVLCFRNKAEVRSWLRRVLKEGLLVGFVGCGWSWTVDRGWVKM